MILSSPWPTNDQQELFVCHHCDGEQVNAQNLSDVTVLRVNRRTI